MKQKPDILRHLELIDEESNFNISPIKNTLEEIKIDDELCQNQKLMCINNTEIYFPYQKPYEEQLKYMKKVITILDNNQNGLLESPTGTGKTFSLLCASLGWLNKNRKTQNNQSIPTKIKIIYASRTHSQLEQVVQELKNTVYRPNISILGSRDKYCLREDLKPYSGNDLSQRCRNIIKSKKCEFFDKQILSIIASYSQKRIFNLKESKQFGLDKELCPYFLEKAKTELADLILLPYNYLQIVKYCQMIKPNYQNNQNNFLKLFQLKQFRLYQILTKIKRLILIILFLFLMRSIILQNALRKEDHLELVKMLFQKQKRSQKINSKIFLLILKIQRKQKQLFKNKSIKDAYQIILILKICLIILFRPQKIFY